MPQQHQRVLFIRLSAIGDIVMASGLPSSIKRSYPDSKLTWLVEAPYKSLVQSHPYVDDVITWPKSDWQRLVKDKQYWQLCKTVWAFRQHLQQQHFSVAIEAQGLIKSAFFAFISGARMRIGFKSKERSHILLNKVVNKPTSPSISSEYKKLAFYIHTLVNGTSLNAKSEVRYANTISAFDYDMCIAVSEDKAKSAQATAATLGLDTPYIAIAPFTTRPQKHWPLTHWQTLIALIRSETTMPIAILGGPKDAAHAEGLTFDNDNVVSLAGKVSLDESISLINTCFAFVGVDTGLTHVATCYKKPTVALFGSTRPYTQTNSIYTHVLFEDMDCAPCRRRPSCDAKYDCMKNLSPKKVFSSLLPYITSIPVKTKDVT
ncbi:glycosyltransferase family 9 protein [Alteromonas sp. 009811495]|uniref:glycosyltransferase family 9 protein n=1 Tax=Alteromonas sp. 009811495 TaxID=3002962 RepID=UPI00237E982C|nr:glycosyltransferase family 9 protein [Alteromonas sp. 009811495]WDT86467.1 glycosyltransferase family 9 protein [Alteromonas sp. 009811495]